MAVKSKISWTDSTWTPFVGTLGKWYCYPDSAGCSFCYAERLNKRFGGPAFRKDADTPRINETIMLHPLQWRVPRMIFVNSQTDTFLDEHPDEWIDRLFATMKVSGDHVFQVLTKRAARMRQYLNDPQTVVRVNTEASRLITQQPKLARRAIDFTWPLPNVWLGVTAENQAAADRRVPELVQIASVHEDYPVRFVSVEPQIGHVDLAPWIDNIDWVITGGESGGPPERAMVEMIGSDLSVKESAKGWVRHLRDQCAQNHVAFYHKQWGGPRPDATGHELDGNEYHQFPVILEVSFGRNAETPIAA